MLIGYARISPRRPIDRPTDRCPHRRRLWKIFTDTMSGSRNDRPGLALEFVRSGGLDLRLASRSFGRSLSHLIDLMQNLERREIGFRSLTEAIDTTTPGGRLTRL
jgi:DNA invertase Pin-like site-specific DNA recombinase